MHTKDLVSILFGAMNTRNLSELEDHLSEEIVFDFPGSGTIQGKKKVLTFLKVLFRQYPKLDFKVENLIREAEQVCVLWSNRGMRKDGKLYQNRGVTIIKVSNGKIISLSDYFKDTSFVKSS